MISYRNEAVGRGPGLHALLIGISDYPYLPGGAKAHESKEFDLGMEQLGSPAISAFQVARWLLQAGDKRLPRPIASIRLLIAPSAAERKRIAEIQTQSGPACECLAQCLSSSADDCTFDKVSAALEEWRDDCSTHSDNSAWFYFAGHGLQLFPRQPVMLLSGYNRRRGGVLDEVLSFQEIFNGMEVTKDFPKMALRQHFVIDACRSQYQAIDDLVNPTLRQPWLYERASGHRTRQYATIFGTTSGGQSYGSAEGTVLSQAFLRALQGEAADAELNDASKRVWTVKQLRLVKALGMLVGQIAKNLGERQAIESGPMNDDLLWSNAPDTPILPVSIELSPAAAHPPETLLVQSEEPGVKPTPVDVSKHPYTVKLEAGLYSASVNFPEWHSYKSKVSGYRLFAQPPWSLWRIPLSAAGDSKADETTSGPD